MLNLNKTSQIIIPIDYKSIEQKKKKKKKKKKKN